MTPTMPFGGRVKERFSISSRSSKPLVRSVRDDHRGAQTGARRDLDLLEVELAVLRRLGGHFLVPLQTGPALGLACLGVGADPLELVFETLLLLGVLLPLDLQPLGLLLQVGGVVAFVRVAAATVELEDPAGHAVEEVAVVGDGEDGALVLFQELLQPLHALGVEVVGGLVEEEQVGCLQQKLAQRHAAALTAGELRDGRVGRRAAKGVHGLLELAVEVPRVAVVELFLELAHLFEQLVGVVGRHLLGDLVEPVEHRLRLGDAFFDVAEDGLVLVERRLLLQHADGEPGHELRVAVGDLLEAGHHPQQGRLTGAVGSDDTDLCSGKEAEGDVVENDLVTMRFAHTLHRVDVLRHAHKPMASAMVALPDRAVAGPAFNGHARDARPRPSLGMRMSRGAGLLDEPLHPGTASRSTTLRGAAAPYGGSERFGSPRRDLVATRWSAEAITSGTLPFDATDEAHSRLPKGPVSSVSGPLAVPAPRGVTDLAAAVRHSPR